MQVKESNKKDFTLPNKGSMGGRLGDSRLYQGVSPVAKQVTSSCCQIAGVPTAAPALSPLALVTNFCATDLPNPSPASSSLLIFAPAIILALLCSSAFCCIKS